MPPTAKRRHLSLSLVYRGLKQPLKSSFPGSQLMSVFSIILNTCESLILTISIFCWWGALARVGICNSNLRRHSVRPLATSLSLRTAREIDLRPQLTQSYTHAYDPYDCALDRRRWQTVR